jgi:hypothetical protein
MGRLPAALPAPRLTDGIPHRGRGVRRLQITGAAIMRLKDGWSAIRTMAPKGLVGSIATPWQRDVGAELPPARQPAQRSASARRSLAALYCAKPTWIVTVA